MADAAILGYVTQASGVVKCVMLVLLAASVSSWTLIVQRGWVLRASKRRAKAFEADFWSGIELNELYRRLKDNETNQSMQQGMSALFVAGFSEFNRLREQTGISPNAVMEGVQRAMRVANAREIDRLEQHLPFLATVGSTSPYIGLFGTVWGIMTAFHALGHVQQASIAMVAPGISEALVATAMGLFAAIPAVIAFNRYQYELERLSQQYLNFQEEFSSILHRQSHGSGL